MGMSGMSSGGRGRRHGRRSAKAVSEINVTPFIDVVLVLLIVFMVTAPLLTVGVPVDLPKSAANTLSEKEEPVVVSINKEGMLYVQETPVDADRMISLLLAVTENNKDLRIFVRGDQTLDYGSVMGVMGRLNAAGFTKVALVSEMPKVGAAASTKGR